MKIIITTFVLAFSSLTLMSFKNSEVELTIPLFDYEADLAAFKDAIESKDKEMLKSMSSDEIDVDMLLMYFEDPEYLKQLKNTQYSDLTSTEFNGTPVIELSIYLSGSDDEGNIYESGISLYFDEGNDGLKLVNMLAAG